MSQEKFNTLKRPKKNFSPRFKLKIVVYVDILIVKPCCNSCCTKYTFAMFTDNAEGRKIKMATELYEVVCNNLD